MLSLHLKIIKESPIMKSRLNILLMKIGSLLQLQNFFKTKKFDLFNLNLDLFLFLFLLFLFTKIRILAFILCFIKIGFCYILKLESMPPKKKTIKKDVKDTKKNKLIQRNSSPSSVSKSKSVSKGKSASKAKPEIKKQ